MHYPYTIPLWKKAPFIRLLIPLIAGIFLQWHFQFPLPIIIIGNSCCAAAYFLFFLFPLAKRFSWQFIQGLLLNLLLLALGLIITFHKDIRNSKSWYGSYYQEDDILVVRIDEPMTEKAKSFKVNGYVEAIFHHNSMMHCQGKILLYFSKQLTDKPTHYNESQLQYGDKILITKNPQRIKNAGNPGAFNYERYAAFQQIFHNVFLKENDWVKLPDKNINPFTKFIFTARENILSILRKNIPAGKDELGIAEALLIGYTNDLDKDLVQAYSNTGVVHIIAISGMHLGLIYVLLVWLFAKIPLINKSKTLQVVLILVSLWMFSLLTGAAASVLRSAVMFTFITIGKNFSKQSSIYNSLAASAFLMLCYNPYFLWDVGFQLSYLAVIGIIIFQKPIYNWMYIKTNLINEIWKLIAISLAAQVLTFPVCIYYFHQFPNFFLITNLIAVPLSSLILFAEIGLVAFSKIPFVNIYLGKIVAWMVWIMNNIILWVNHLPFAVYDKIPSTVASTLLLYAIVICLSNWLLSKSKRAFQLALFCLCSFALLHAHLNWRVKNQQKIIVYNVPQQQAIDFVRGNTYQFLGDSILLKEGVLQNFHLKPARIAMQLNKRVYTMDNLFHQQLFYQFGNTKLLVIDSSIQFEMAQQKIDIDIIIISKSVKLHMSQLACVFNCKHYIFDASNSWWKIDQWKKEANALHLNFYSIPDEGAFVFNIGM